MTDYLKALTKDLAEELTIVSLVTIALVSLFLLGVESKEIVIAIAAGLIGYLKGTKKETPPKEGD